MNAEVPCNARDWIRGTWRHFVRVRRWFLSVTDVPLAPRQDVEEMEQLEYQLQRENEDIKQQIQKAIAERSDSLGRGYTVGVCLNRVTRRPSTALSHRRLSPGRAL